MDIIYKKLTEVELDRFIQMRINQLCEEGAAEDIDLVPNLKDYYKRHMSDGTFVSWLAVDGDEIIGTSGMSFVEKPPYFGCPSGKIGLLSSMYTNPNYRRKGIAKELLSRVINEAKEFGCGTVQITASDMGVKLYTDFGFKHNGNFMRSSYLLEIILLFVGTLAIGGIIGFLIGLIVSKIRKFEFVGMIKTNFCGLPI